MSIAEMMINGHYEALGMDYGEWAEQMGFDYDEFHHGYNSITDDYDEEESYSDGSESETDTQQINIENFKIREAHLCNEYHLSLDSTYTEVPMSGTSPCMRASFIEKIDTESCDKANDSGNQPTESRSGWTTIESKSPAKSYSGALKKDLPDVRPLHQKLIDKYDHVLPDLKSATRADHGLPPNSNIDHTTHEIQHVSDLSSAADLIIVCDGRFSDPAAVEADSKTSPSENPIKFTAIPVHRKFLKLNSKYFDNLLADENGWLETELLNAESGATSTLKLALQPKPLTILLRWIYSKRLILSEAEDSGETINIRNREDIFTMIDVFRLCDELCLEAQKEYIHSWISQAVIKVCHTALFNRYMTPEQSEQCYSKSKSQMRFLYNHDTRKEPYLKEKMKPGDHEKNEATAQKDMELFMALLDLYQAFPEFKDVFSCFLFTLPMKMLFLNEAPAQLVLSQYELIRWTSWPKEIFIIANEQILEYGKEASDLHSELRDRYDAALDEDEDAMVNHEEAFYAQWESLRRYYKILMIWLVANKDDAYEILQSFPLSMLGLDYLKSLLPHLESQPYYSESVRPLFEKAFKSAYETAGTGDALPGVPLHKLLVWGIQSTQETEKRMPVDQRLKDTQQRLVALEHLQKTYKLTIYDPEIEELKKQCELLREQDKQRIKACLEAQDMTRTLINTWLCGSKVEKRAQRKRKLDQSEGKSDSLAGRSKSLVSEYDESIRAAIESRRAQIAPTVKMALTKVAWDNWTTGSFPNNPGDHFLQLFNKVPVDLKTEMSVGDMKSVARDMYYGHYNKLCRFTDYGSGWYDGPKHLPHDGIVFVSVRYWKTENIAAPLSKEEYVKTFHQRQQSILSQPIGSTDVSRTVVVSHALELAWPDVDQILDQLPSPRDGESEQPDTSASTTKQSLPEYRFEDGNDADFLFKEREYGRRKIRIDFSAGLSDDQTVLHDMVVDNNLKGLRSEIEFMLKLPEFVYNDTSLLPEMLKYDSEAEVNVLRRDEFKYREQALNAAPILTETNCHRFTEKNWHWYGYTALNVAIENGRDRAVRMLLHAGADPTLKSVVSAKAAASSRNTESGRNALESITHLMSMPPATNANTIPSNSQLMSKWQLLNPSQTWGDSTQYYPDLNVPYLNIQKLILAVQPFWSTASYAATKGGDRKFFDNKCHDIKKMREFLELATQACDWETSDEVAKFKVDVFKKDPKNKSGIKGQCPVKIVNSTYTLKENEYWASTPDVAGHFSAIMAMMGNTRTDIGLKMQRADDFDDDDFGYAIVTAQSFTHTDDTQPFKTRNLRRRFVINVDLSSRNYGDQLLESSSVRRPGKHTSCLATALMGIGTSKNDARSECANRRCHNLKAKECSSGSCGRCCDDIECPRHVAPALHPRFHARGAADVRNFL